MVQYILTTRVYNTLIGRGFELKCKTCGFPLQIGDCIESKPSKYRKRKFYHCECYNGCHMESTISDEEADRELEELEKG